MVALFVRFRRSGRALLVASVLGCSKDAPSAKPDAAPAAMSGDAAVLVTDVDGAARGDVAAEGQAPDGGAAEAQHDRTSGAPACEGKALSLLDVVLDERCALAEREWRLLGRGGEGRSDGGAIDGLRQEARRDGDGIIVSIVNRGRAPVVVPLRFHPAHPELAFSVLAEDDKHAVFELAPPKIELPRTDARSHDARRFALPPREAPPGLDAGRDALRVHQAALRLPPGGSARARIELDPRVTRRLDRNCGDAGACVPARLPNGRVVLYVGQTISTIDTGAPARLEWDVR